MMRDRKTSRTIRIMAGVIGAMMLLLVLSSAFCLAAEEDHDCCGRDCPVCACLEQCRNTLFRLKAGAAVRFPAVIPLLFILPAADLVAALFSQTSLVSQKIRLND